ncbi:1,4-alpha-glucan branching protein GlgB [Sansalvadorimonas verongulae]|uniref:1,4-alpha-glucan branching protein GlgB n=1 Tax=Sansalvadorimonas verongulae TaxID=2172824 RepID=UPI0012BB4AD7|nr:1,4-alpha-glucan branching protein GlgB [Sansalvadorimonas verongulae]MTI13922.1 1,4-alpha-glucan branching protein GlgB [Sansalvadorimonas verongulae]
MHEEQQKSEEVQALADDLGHSRCAQPFNILGVQKRPGEGMVSVRVWYPEAMWLRILDNVNDKVVGDMEPSSLVTGLFELTVPEDDLPSVYIVEGESANEGLFEFIDPYQFGGDCLRQGDIDYYHLHHHLGAHVHEHACQDRAGNPLTLAGVLFKVYAPRARSISVIGSFNYWDGRTHPMSSGEGGIWRLFVPDAKIGDLYKFEIRNQKGELLPYKADPFGFYAEQAPGNASIVYDNHRYQWQSQNRKSGSDNIQNRPVSIYEVHAGSWKKEQGYCLTYKTLAEQLIPYVVDMGFTHIEFLPLMEHPFTGSWGYQPVGLFAPTSRYGAPDDFKCFVDQCHENGIGVIMDWVPAHFPEDGHGLSLFDGTALYEYGDPKRGWHPDWKTLIFDYGKPFVRQFLISNALFWFEHYRIDGLRVDAVASMLYLDYSRNEGEWERNIYGGNEHLEAVSFLKELNETVFCHYPHAMMIAEESTSWPGVSQPTWDNGLGFNFKWNMGWMHDSLNYFSRPTEYRKYHHNELIFSMVYHYSEHFVLPVSHDEVVHGKGTLLTRMPGDEWQRFANLRAYLGFMYAHPGKKLLFMGTEFGTHLEWNHDGELDWWLIKENQFCPGVSSLIRDLNRLYKEHSALWELDYEQDGFQWVINDDNEQSVIALLRRDTGHKALLVICNLTPVVRHNYSVGVPQAGTWKEMLNTDGECYGGSGVTNPDVIVSNDEPLHGHPFSLRLTLPPLATLYLSF